MLGNDLIRHYHRVSHEYSLPSPEVTFQEMHPPQKKKIGNLACPGINKLSKDRETAADSVCVCQLQAQVPPKYTQSKALPRPSLQVHGPPAVAGHIFPPQ